METDVKFSGDWKISSKFFGNWQLLNQHWYYIDYLLCIWIVKLGMKNRKLYAVNWSWTIISCFILKSGISYTSVLLNLICKLKILYLSNFIRIKYYILKICNGRTIIHIFNKYLTAYYEQRIQFGFRFQTQDTKASSYFSFLKITMRNTRIYSVENNHSNESANLQSCSV